MRVYLVFCLGVLIVFSLFLGLNLNLTEVVSNTSGLFSLNFASTTNSICSQYPNTTVSLAQLVSYRTSWFSGTMTLNDILVKAKIWKYCSPVRFCDNYILKDGESSCGTKYFGGKGVLSGNGPIRSIGWADYHANEIEDPYLDSNSEWNPTAAPCTGASCDVTEFTVNRPFYPSLGPNEVLLVKKLRSKINFYGRKGWGDLVNDVFPSGIPVPASDPNFLRYGYELGDSWALNSDLYNITPFEANLIIPGEGYPIKSGQSIWCGVNAYISQDLPNAPPPRVMCEIDYVIKNKEDVDPKQLVIPVRFPKVDLFRILVNSSQNTDLGFGNYGNTYPYVAGDPVDLFSLKQMDSSTAGPALQIPANPPSLKPDCGSVCGGRTYWGYANNSQRYFYDLLLKQEIDKGRGQARWNNMFCNDCQHMTTDVEFPTRNAIDIATEITKLKNGPQSSLPKCVTIKGGYLANIIYHAGTINRATNLAIYSRTGPNFPTTNSDNLGDGLTNTEFSAKTYWYMFGREAATSERDYWAGALNSGSINKNTMIYTFYIYPEFQERYSAGINSNGSDFIRFLYSALLGVNNPDSYGVTYWTNELSRVNNDKNNIARQFIDSVYFARAFNQFGNKFIYLTSIKTGSVDYAANFSQRKEVSLASALGITSFDNANIPPINLYDGNYLSIANWLGSAIPYQQGNTVLDIANVIYLWPSDC
jgi:hypothetical protein